MLFGLCFASLYAAASFGVPSLSPQVHVESGWVVGASNGGVSAFKGIPYAAPPVGNLRWREPQLPVAWTGVLHANKFAPACMQIGVSMPGETPPAVSEDCLYLNVWAPARSGIARLPVMVWIYGGGFITGNASMPLYWGDRLARKGIIFVSFGYRVGPFGFLTHHELTRESPHHSSGNYGFMDQIAALKWVKRNISAFGGDPCRVTVAGQSAGATSVSVLMCSPLAKGLFERAIEQSGGLFEPVQLAPRVLLANAELEGESYVKSLHLRTIADLRALPARALLRGEWQNVSHEVIEPYVLPDSPYNTFLAGHQNNVPVLAGSNADEYRAMIADPGAIRASTFAEDLTRSLGALPPALMAAYPFSNDAQAHDARMHLERDIRFGWDMWSLARLVSSVGKNRMYYYHFTQSPPFPKDSVRAGWGPSHYAELWYAFDHLDQESWHWSPQDRALARSMSSYWANFVKNGDPNGRSLPRWPQFCSSRPSVLYLGDKVHVGGVADLQSLTAVDRVYAKVRGAPFGLVPH